MNYYAFTVKKTMDYVIDPEELVKDYEDWVKYSITCGFSIEKWVYEMDPKGLLHIHGIAYASSRFYKKKCLRKGYHQNIEKLETQKDIVQWMIYITKDQCCKDWEKAVINWEHQSEPKIQ